VQNLAIKLQQGLCNCYALFCQMRDVYGMHAYRMCLQDTSGICANVTLELSCTIVINTLYRQWSRQMGEGPTWVLEVVKSTEEIVLQAIWGSVGIASRKLFNFGSSEIVFYCSYCVIFV